MKEIANIKMKTILHENRKVASVEVSGAAPDVISLLIDGIGEVLAKSIKPDVDLDEAMSELARDVKNTILQARGEKDGR